MCLLKYRSRPVSQFNFRNKLSRRRIFYKFCLKLMAWHGPWVLADFFVGGGACPKNPHGEKSHLYRKRSSKKAPTWRKSQP